MKSNSTDGIIEADVTDALKDLMKDMGNMNSAAVTMGNDMVSATVDKGNVWLGVSKNGTSVSVNLTSLSTGVLDMKIEKQATVEGTGDGKIDLIAGLNIKKTLKPGAAEEFVNMYQDAVDEYLEKKGDVKNEYLLNEEAVPDVNTFNREDEQKSFLEQNKGLIYGAAALSIVASVTTGGLSSVLTLLLV